MISQSNLDFHSLENNIADVIKEEQIKLGYREETVRLYYPMESLNGLLGVELSVYELQNALDEFCHYVKERFGEVKYSRNEKRFCIVIPPTGVNYVHEKVEDREYLQEFIMKVSEPHCSLDDILLTFQRYSDYVKCEKLENEEFDYMVYFEDGKPDSYRYCIKFEDCHVIYHRFTKTDYEKLGI